MLLRRRFPRLFAALAMLLVLGFLGGAVLPIGCGGDDAPKKKKKKKKKKKGGGKGGGAAEPSEEDVEREMIKDQFKGVYNEFYNGNADYPALYKALTDAEKALEKYDKTVWNEEFNTMIMGLNYGRVELAEWYLSKKKAAAFKNLEDKEAGMKILQEAADFLKPVDPSKLDKLKIGGGSHDYKEYFNGAQKAIKAAFKEFETMVAIVGRTPPSGEFNLCDADESLWEKEGPIDATMGGGDIVLEAKGKGARLTSLHYYLKDFKLKITFTIQSGGFDILLRTFPGKGSPFNGGYSRENLPDPNAPFTLIIEMVDSSAQFMDSEGRPLYDEPIIAESGPKGGGIGILLRDENSAMVIQELTIEPK
ncbi:MAG: hypothetical protein ACYS47_07970 [Planctomycetota bacterium]|jgi:hypothetical protein